LLLIPRNNVPERILSYGTMGSGKSYALARIATRLPPPASVYVIDNDGTWRRLLTSPEFEHLTNVHVYPVDRTDFQGHVDRIADIATRVQPQDWVCVDLLTPTWDAVQGWYSDQVFHQSIEDYFIEVRSRKSTGKQGGDDKTLAAFEGFMDWPVINKVYQGKFMVPLMSLPCHIYCTAEADKVSETGKIQDSRDTKALFGPYGAKPKGQKTTGHRFATVLLMTKDRIGGWTMTTVKDIGRPILNNQPVSDFATDYLLKVARWMPRAAT
jgi:hypothetical protein